MVIFDGTGTIGQPQTLISGYNVSSVVKSAVGKYKINFVTPFADTNYIMLNPSILIGTTSLQSEDTTTSPTRTSAYINVCNYSSDYADTARFGAVFYR